MSRQPFESEWNKHISGDLRRDHYQILTDYHEGRLTEYPSVLKHSSTRVRALMPLREEQS